MAIACGALVPVNPTNIPPVPTPPYLPLYPPPAYPINMGSPGTTSLQNVLLEIASAKPYFTLLDWNGNPYTASELLQQGGSSLGTAYWASQNDNWADANFWASQAASALLQTSVEYSQTLGTIIWIKNGERFGTLYQIVPPVPSPPNTQIRYLNVMNHVATPTDPIVLVNPKITGLSLRITWGELEPTQGIYDFSYFDTEIERAIGAGKDFIMLRVLVEQNNAPAWVYQISQWATFSSGQLWIYWDPNGMAAKIAMYQALGDRYSGIPQVKVFAVACDTDRTGDWVIPHLGSDVPLWNSLGYSTARNQEACQTYIDASATAFPNQIITLACGRNGNLDVTEDYLCQQLAIENFSQYGKRFAIQKNQLNATVPLPQNSLDDEFHDPSQFQPNDLSRYSPSRNGYDRMPVQPLVLPGAKLLQFRWVPG